MADTARTWNDLRWVARDAVARRTRRDEVAILYRDSFWYLILSSEVGARVRYDCGRKKFMSSLFAPV